MSKDLMMDKPVARVTVVRHFPDECGIQEGTFSEEGGRVVGRRKAQKFIFEHLVDGCACIPAHTNVNGRHVTVLALWSTKEVEND